MCHILGCKYYAGKYSTGLCSYHVFRFSLLAVIKEETTKHRGIGKPVHNRIVKKIKY
jgi:hypothetical protein